MNKELLIKRISDLNEDVKKHQNAIYAIIGAIQDCEHWLKQLEEPKKENTEEQKNG